MTTAEPPRHAVFAANHHDGRRLGEHRSLDTAIHSAKRYTRIGDCCGSAMVLDRPSQEWLVVSGENALRARSSAWQAPSEVLR
jgi:hypothetical protein